MPLGEGGGAASQLVRTQLIFDQCIWVGRYSANYQPAVDQVLIKCQPSIYQDVDRVLIKMSIKGISFNLFIMVDSFLQILLKLIVLHLIRLSLKVTMPLFTVM